MKNYNFELYFEDEDKDFQIEASFKNNSDVNDYAEFLKSKYGAESVVVYIESNEWWLLSQI